MHIIGIPMKRTATSPTVPPKKSRLPGTSTTICNTQQESIFNGKTFTEQFDMPVFDKMVKCKQLRDKPNEYKRWTK